MSSNNHNQTRDVECQSGRPDIGGIVLDLDPNAPNVELEAYVKSTEISRKAERATRVIIVLSILYAVLEIALLAGPRFLASQANDGFDGLLDGLLLVIVIFGLQAFVALMNLALEAIQRSKLSKSTRLIACFPAISIVVTVTAVVLLAHFGNSGNDDIETPPTCTNDCPTPKY